jgi:esterase/lipase
MLDELDAEKKARIFELIIRRYENMIGEKEERSISEIRQRISPYDETIKMISNSITKDYVPYNYETHFLTAAQRALDYIRQIKTCKLQFTFWLTFEEIEHLKAADAMNKALMLVAILRALGSKDAKVLVTKSGRIYVAFISNKQQYMVNLESGSVLANEDGIKLFENDALNYAFNDLFYENYTEE